jgi:hypothetical protein
MVKEASVHILGHYLFIFLTEENHEEFQDSLCPGGHCNGAPLEYKSETLSLELICSVSGPNIEPGHPEYEAWVITLHNALRYFF